MTKAKPRNEPTTVRENRPGPKPEVLKIDTDWQDAVKQAMQNKKPPGGWPR